MEMSLADDARRMRDGLQSRLKTEIRTRKSAETRQRIMDTAAELIAERGNTVFKMSEVSRRCGMSKGALYYYFNDKQDLVRAIFEHEVSDLMRVLDESVAQANTAGEALRGMCEEFVRRVSGGGVMAMALVRELAITREPGSYAQNKRVRHIVGLIAELLERAKDEGIVRPDVDAHFAAVSVCGMFTFSAVSVSEMRSSGGGTLDDYASRLYDLVLHGIGVSA